MCVGRLRIDEFSETRLALAAPVTAHAIAESNTLLFTVPSPSLDCPIEWCHKFFELPENPRALFNYLWATTPAKTTSDNWGNSGRNFQAHKHARAAYFRVAAF
jgi:hypothetical protein